MSAILAGGIKGNFPLFAGHKNPPGRQKHAQARTGDATAARTAGIKQPSSNPLRYDGNDHTTLPEQSR